MHLFTKVMGDDPIKEETVIITMGQFTNPPKLIPTDEYHFYTISTFSRSNPPPPKKKRPGTCMGHHSLCTSFIFIFFTLWLV
jgi:hypothetical protein